MLPIHAVIYVAMETPQTWWYLPGMMVEVCFAILDSQRGYTVGSQNPSNLEPRHLAVLQIGIECNNLSLDAVLIIFLIHTGYLKEASKNTLKSHNSSFPQKSFSQGPFNNFVKQPTNQRPTESTEFDTSNSHFISIIISKRKIPRCHSMLRSQALMAAPEKIVGHRDQQKFHPF